MKSSTPDVTRSRWAPLLALLGIGLAFFAGLATCPADAEPSYAFWKISGTWPGFSRGIPLDFAVSGNRTFITLDEEGWLIIDWTDPLHPTPYAFHHDPLFRLHPNAGIESADNLVYVAEENNGLAIYDGESPGTPVLLGRFQQEGFCASLVRIQGQYAYVWDPDTSALALLDVSHPKAPVFVGQCADSSGGWFDDRFAVNGQTVYFIVNDTDLVMVDASDPTRPSWSKPYSLASWAVDLAISGTFAYVATEDGIQVLDLQDPLRPIEASFLDLAELDGYFPVNIYVAGQQAFVSTETGLLILDISQPRVPRVLSSLDDLGEVDRARGTAQHTWLLMRDGMLNCVDVTQTNQPSIVASYTLGNQGQAVAVAFSGSTALLADSGGGLKLLDVQDPTHPNYIGRVPDLSDASKVSVSGGYAFAASESTLAVIDLRNPNQSIQITSLSFTNTIHALEILSDKAYLALGQDGLAVVDVKDPHNPRLLGLRKIGTDLRDVKGSNQILCLADNIEGLLVYSTNNLDSMVRLGSYPAEDASKVRIEGTIGFLLTDLGELHLIELADITSPQLLSSIWSPYLNYSISIRGGYVCLANRLGVEILDARQPTHPVSIAICPTPGWPTDAIWMQDRILVAAAESGLVVIEPDLDPMRPPRIFEGPQSVAIGLGEPVTLRISASGPEPLTYQWFKNGVEIPGAASNIVEIVAATLADAGTYSVAVSNPNGRLESAPAMVSPFLPPFLGQDDFPAKTALTSPQGSLIDDNSGATMEADEPAHAGKLGWRSLWYQWCPPASGIATLRATGSSFDTLLGVYTGTNLAELIEVASDDDRGDYLTSMVRFNAKRNQAYHIAVASRSFSTVAASVRCANGYAYIVDEKSGLGVYNLANPVQPHLIGVFQSENLPDRLLIEGTTVYLIDSASGMEILDVSVPTMPMLLGSIEWANNWYDDLVVSNGLLYAVDGSKNELAVYDARNPRNPTLMARHPSEPLTGPDPWKIQAIGTALLIAAFDGLVTLDVSDPLHPTLIDSKSNENLIDALQVAGNYAFVVTAAPSLEVYAITGSAELSLKALTNIPLDALFPFLAIAEGYAFIGDPDHNTIQVVDVRDPQNPRWISQYQTTTSARDIAVQGNHIYVANGPAGLLVLDLADPYNLRPIGGRVGSFNQVILSWDLEITDQELPVVQLQPPPGVLATLGSELRLQIEASPPDCSFQWLRNGEIIPNATQPLLIRNPVFPSDTGVYRVRITGPNGRWLDSRDVQLDVTPQASAIAATLAASKFEDLFNTTFGPASVQSQTVRQAMTAPSQGLGGGTRWVYSPDTRLPPVYLEDCRVSGTNPRWFKYRPNPFFDRTSITITTKGSEFATLLAVYTNRLDRTLVACALPPQGQLWASLRLAVSSGTEYYILVASLDGQKGVIQLNTPGTATEASFEEWRPLLLQNHFSIVGPLLPGIYRIESTDSLGLGHVWHVLETQQSKGRIDFIDPESAIQPARFYRLSPSTP